MARRGEISPYKPVRTKSSYVCSTIFCKKYSKQTHSITNGQQDSRCLYKQDGGHSIKTVELLGESILGLVPSKTVDSNCRLYPREKQCDCGLGKQKPCGFQRLEIESNNFQESDVSIRSMQCRPFRGQIECSAEPLLQLETRLTSESGRRTFTTLEGDKGLCFPTFLPDKFMSGQGQGGEGSDSTSNSHLANPGMVSPTPPDVDRGSSTDPNELQHSPVSIERDTPPNSKPNVEISRVEGLRRSFTTIGISEEAKELLLGSWKSGTRSAYDSAWHKWSGWCHTREIDPF